MPIFNASLLNILLGIAATFLGLAVLVQVFQEIYKFLTSSRSRAYTKVLVDFLGPWATQLMRPSPLLDMQVSGPFQIRKLRPRGILLPMNQEGLVNALERTAPHWIQRTVAQLKFECKLQGDKKGKTSPEWTNFLEELGEVEKGAPGYWNAHEVAQFLSIWGHKINRPKNGSKVGKISAPKEVISADILVAFRRKFLAHVENVNEHFPQLENNLQYAYRRRNLRQTFTFAFIIAVMFNLPFERIYHAASKASPEETVAVAERTIELYEGQMDGFSQDDSLAAEKHLTLARGILDESLISLSGDNVLADYLVDREDIIGLSEKKVESILRFIFGCLLTALLVSFGAPFWNDIVKSVLRIKQSKRPGTGNTGKGQAHA